MSFVSDDNACFKVIKRELVMEIPMRYIGREEETINKILNSWKFKYNEQLNGILLSFSNIQFVSDYGKIVDEEPDIYWTISGEFKVFDVNEGQLIKGKINQFGVQYVTCSVADCIDATITLDENISEELSPFIKIDKQIIFEVNSVDSDNCFIEGTITEECLNKMKQLFEITDNDNDENAYQDHSFV